MDALRLLFGFSGFVLAGLPLILLLRFISFRKSWWPYLCFSFIAGMGVLSLQMFLTSMTGRPFSVWKMLLPWAVLSPALLLLPFIRRSFLDPEDALLEDEKGPNGTIPVILWSFLVAWPCLYALIYAPTLPVYGWDAWAVWLYKARVFFTENQVTREFLLSPMNINPLHPVLTSLSAAWIMLCLGAMNDILAEILYPVQFLSLLTVFYFFSKRLASRIHAMMFTALLAHVPLLLIHGGGFFFQLRSQAVYSVDFVGYADLMVSVYVLAGSGLLALGMQSGSFRYFIASVMFMGFSAWTKSEGIVFVMSSLFLISFWILLKRRSALPALVFLFLVACLPPGIWFAVKKMLALKSFYGPGLTPQGLMEGASRLPVILTSLRTFLFEKIDLYNFCWWAYAFFAIWNVKKILRPQTLCLHLLILFQIAAYCLIFMTTPADVGWQIGTSMDRLVLQLVPTALLITAINVHQLTEPSR